MEMHTGPPKYLIHTSKCRIPNDDPFNEDVKKFFHREEYVTCSKKPLLTYVETTDSVSTLHVNRSLLGTYSLFKISCCHSSVTRIVHANKSDDEVSFSECVPFESSVNITDLVVMVKCKTSLGVVYSNVHAAISSRHVPESKMKRNWTSETTPFGVLFVGIDSISKMNLVRTMPKTYEFLRGRDFYDLKGYTKIGDNTFPNLMAILTGKTWTQVYEHCDPKKNKMNNCDMIWDKFSDLGYITAYAEDESSIGTFNYNRKGFASPPTDFYMRPYVIATEQLPSIKKFGMHTCSGPESSGERIMNLAKDFAVTFPHHPKFGLFWMNTFSHDNLNLPSSMDAKVEQFLRGIYDHLNNTIFVFFSDHGFRFGEIRYTHTGWLEERLPYIYIHLPKRFKERHPAEFNNFLTNTKRLSNPFDVHMTLQDVLLSANQTYSVRPSLACPKCHSLFKEIDEARTCKDCAIEQHWCMCSGHSYVNPAKKIVVDSAEFIVSQINALVKADEEGHKCAYYYLKKIVSSGMSESYLNELNHTVNFFLIMLETRPPAM
ncbi:hypothetical protein GEV33_012462 [Tenebrio molitor]|uniref:DUF229 domain containing protein n=1 Tax=Tenebrio molitor TaxID=7067 RepID=A0A8J6H8R2_TENMO|nr:hypothetical protein GEV33_012462 [Tenebrio molitor]